MRTTTTHNLHCTKNEVFQLRISSINVILQVVSLYFSQTLEEPFLKAGLDGWFYKESMFNKKVHVL